MEIQYNKDISGRNILYILGAIAVLLIGTGIVLYQENRVPPQSDSQLNHIAQTPNQFIGKDVSVSGNIENLLGSRAFALEVPGMFDEKVLVISKDPLIPVGGADVDQSFFNEEQRVHVQGNVREFRVKEVEAELGVDLIDDQFTEYEGKPFIYADLVREDR